MAGIIEVSSQVMAITPGKIWVTVPTQTCTACQRPCGLSTLGQLENPTGLVPIYYNAPITVGEEITLTITEPELFQAGMIAYLIPTILTIGGAGLASVLNSSDQSTILGAGLGLVTGLLLTHLFARFIRTKPQITRKWVFLSESNDD